MVMATEYKEFALDSCSCAKLDQDICDRCLPYQIAIWVGHSNGRHLRRSTLLNISEYNIQCIYYV